jgi:hydroxymethylpyrimidine pyrophosphatase-like HAD family hydrolase
MALYYHEKQKFIYDTDTKKYLMLQTFTKDYSEYRQYPNNEDVGTYYFYQEKETKISEYEDKYDILDIWCNYVEITHEQKEEILKRWEQMVRKDYVCKGSSASDDCGSITVREMLED